MDAYTEPAPPPIAPKLHISVTGSLLARLDRWVGSRYPDRSECIRALLTQALDALDERAARLP